MKKYLEVNKPIQALNSFVLDARETVKNLQELENIKNPYLGLIIYDEDTQAYYKVISLFTKTDSILGTTYYITTSNVVRTLERGDTGPQGPQGIQGPIGPQGPAGKDGANGKDGTSVKIVGSVSVESDLGTIDTSKLSLGDGYLVGGNLWIYYGTNQPDGGTYKYFAANDSYWLLVGEIKGPKGETGATGAQGPAGPKGDNGIAPMLYIRYADDAAGTNMNNYKGAYMGIYIDYNNSGPSKDPNDYTWTNTQGIQGIQGKWGCVHIAYAYDQQGGGFTTGEAEDRTYIGFYVDFAENGNCTDSGNWQDYTWMRVTGAVGTSFKYKVMYKAFDVGMTDPILFDADKDHPGYDWNSVFPEYDSLTQIVYAIDATFQVNEDGSITLAKGETWGNLRPVTAPRGQRGVAPNYTVTVFALTKGRPNKPTSQSPIEPGTSNVPTTGETAAWVDYPNSDEVEGKRWWSCIGSVNGTAETVVWGEVQPCSGKDGKDGVAQPSNFLEWRFINAEETPTIINPKSRNPESYIKGVLTTWSYAGDPPVVAENEFMWATTCYVTPSNTLDGEWSAPWKVSGERGPVGGEGPIGPPGPSGIPGVTYEERYMLGTADGPKTPWQSSMADDREPEGWTTSIPKVTNQYMHIWCIKARTWKPEGSEVWKLEPNATWEGPFKISGTPGKEGKRGQLVYPAGTYNENAMYVTDENKAPYVYDPDGRAFFVLNAQMTWVGRKASNISYPAGVEDQKGQTPYENSISNYPVWVKFEMFDAIYTQIGIIENGSVGSAVFNGDYVFSMQGKDKNGNNSSRYEDFMAIDKTDPYSTRNNFYPNICFNFRTGAGWLAGSRIKWDKDGAVTLDSNVKIEWSQVKNSQSILENAINTENIKLKNELLADINKHREDIDELQTLQDAVSKSLGEAKQEITNTKNALNSTNASINEINANLTSSINSTKSYLEQKYDKDVLDLNATILATKIALNETINELEEAKNSGDAELLAKLNEKAAQLQGALDSLNNRQNGLQQSITENNQALSSLQDVVNNLSEAGLTQRDVVDLIETAFIQGISVDVDTIEAPNINTNTLLALVAKFGKVKAANITSGTIQGSNIQSDISINNAGTDASGVVKNPTWKLNNDGTGYFAKKNIEWNANGDLTVKGTIEAGGGSKIGSWYTWDDGTISTAPNSSQYQPNILFKPDGSGHLCYENISWDENGNLYLGSLGDNTTVTVGDGAWIVTADGNIKAANNNAMFRSNGSGYLGGFDTATQKYKGLSWDEAGNVTINSQLKYNFQVIDLNTTISESSKPTSLIIKDVNKYLIKDSSASTYLLDPNYSKKSLYLAWWASAITPGTIIDVEIINGTSDTITIQGLSNNLWSKNKTNILVPIRNSNDYILPQNNFSLKELNYNTGGYTNQIFLLPGTTLQLQLYKENENATTLGYVKNIDAFQLTSSDTGTNGKIQVTNVLCSIAPEHNNLPINNAGIADASNNRSQHHYMLRCLFDYNYSNLDSLRTICKNNNLKLGINGLITSLYPSTSSNVLVTFTDDRKYKTVSLFNEDYSSNNITGLKDLSLNYGLTFSEVTDNIYISSVRNIINRLYTLNIGNNINDFKNVDVPYSVTLNLYIPTYGKLFTSTPINLNSSSLTINEQFKFGNDIIDNLLATLFNSTQKSLDIYTFISVTPN